MKKINTGTDEIHIDEHGIIHKRVIEGAHIDLAKMVATEKACAELAAKDKYLVLVDARALHTMTPDAVEELKNNLTTKRIAAAILSDKLGMRILIDYLAKAQDSAPVKIFREYDEALNWLLQFKKN